jgi:hypothetical protein
VSGQSFGLIALLRAIQLHLQGSLQMLDLKLNGIGGRYDDAFNPSQIAAELLEDFTMAKAMSDADISDVKEQDTSAGPPEMMALAQLLTNARHLMTVNLCSNDLRSEDMRPFVRMLKGWTEDNMKSQLSLRHLYLDDNEIGPEEGRDLEEICSAQNVLLFKLNRTYKEDRRRLSTDTEGAAKAASAAAAPAGVATYDGELSDDDLL